MSCFVPGWLCLGVPPAAPLARSVAGSCSPYSAHGSAETGHRVVTRWRDIPDTVRQGWAMDRV
jgi:hypothetical protein